MRERTSGAGGPAEPRGLARWEGGRATLAVMALLLLAGSLLYANTLAVPWYFDDIRNIVENRSLRDLGARFGGVFENRGFSYLTFALNMAAGGLDVTGYHLVNIAVHILCAAAVYFLLRDLFPAAGAWPALGALLFLAHPVQTQAVTYIVQRMASQSALFFLISLLLYRRARAQEAGGAMPLSARFLVPYGGALACGALAALSKENAMVLPGALLLLDLLLPAAGESFNCRRDLPRLLPFLAIPALLAVQQLGGADSTLHDMDRELAYRAELFKAAPEGEGLRGEGLWARYLATEAIVFWKYARLVLLPAGQRLEYAYPLVRSALNPSSLAAAAGILGLVSAALLLRRREPRLSFGILWVILTLAPESTLIPVDPVFEHRLYLPLAGFVVIAVDLLRRLPSRAALSAAGVAVVVLSALTVRRNALWGDPVAFWEDNLRKAPDAVGVRMSLGIALAESGKTGGALEHLELAVKLRPANYMAHGNLGTLLLRLEKPEAALEHLREAVALKPDYYQGFSDLGVGLCLLKSFPDGIEQFRRALEIYPDFTEARFNLGKALERTGDRRGAIDQYRRALRLDPGHEKARRALDKATASGD